MSKQEKPRVVQQKDNRGGRREGAGRPHGSKNIYSSESVKKLESLGFDPIEKTVEMFYEVRDAIQLLEAEGKTTSGAYAQLQTTLGTLINNLMRYGYRQVPEKQEISVEQKQPLAVKLNLPGRKLDD